MNVISTMLKSAAVAAMALCWMDASAAVNFVADPDPENMVSELSSVTVTFPDADEVDTGSQYLNVKVIGPGTPISCSLGYGLEDNEMIISFAKITAPGTYTIDIPEDAIVADGTAVEAFTITYNVGTEVVDNATLIPAPGDVEWLYEIIYSNPDVEFNLSVDNSLDEKPSVTSPSGEVARIYDVYNYEIGAGKYTFRLRKLATEPGTYKITIPENYLYYNDASYTRHYLPAYEFTYEVLGGELTEVISNPSMTEPTTNFNHISMEFPGYSTIDIKQMTYTEKTISVYMDGQESAITSFYLEKGSYYFEIEGNKMSYTNQYSDYITPGHYYFTIPGGSILLGEDQTPCTPFVVDFEVVAPEPVEINITPADGTTVSMLNQATITFPELTQVDLARSPSVRLEKITVEDGVESKVSIGGAYSSTSFDRLSDNSFIAKFNGMALTDGDYRITVVVNSFVFDGGFNQEYSVNVHFEAPEAPEATLTPDNSVAQDKLQNFTITFPTESVVNVNSMLSNKSTILYEGDELISNGYGGYINQQVGLTDAYTAVEGTANSFSFVLSSAGINPGKYTLRIPAGIFLMGEEPTSFNEEILVVYECTGEGIDKIEVSPSEPVRQLSELKITFINETSVSLQSAYTGFSLYQFVEGQSYGNYITYLSGDNIRTEENSLIITFSEPITAEGTYYIEIGTYSLYMSDGVTRSTPQKVYFTIDPNGEVNVEGIHADMTSGRIFSITGIEVKDMKTPGIYIVNGKKIVVK